MQASVYEGGGAITILLIDDSASVARLFSHMLQISDYADAPFVHLSSVEDAEDYLSGSEDVGVILLDNRLPPFRRFDIPLQRLRRLTTAPIYLFTATELEELGFDEPPAGLNGYFSKNELKPETLNAFLKRVLG